MDLYGEGEPGLQNIYRWRVSSPARSRPVRTELVFGLRAWNQVWIQPGNHQGIHFFWVWIQPENEN